MEGMERGGYGSKETTHGLRKGGFRATMFIFIMTGLENVGFVANMVSMVLYFLLVMHFNLADSATTLTNFMGSTFLLTIVGGFIADTFLTRLNTVLVFAFFQILGYILVTIQAHQPNLRPPGLCLTCKLEGKNEAMFYVSLCLLALGYGGVRGAYPALGADQFDKNNYPKETKSVASFFNWLLLSITLGATLGVTVIVWVSTDRSWALGFFISLMCAILGFCIITAGKPFYRTRIVKDSPLLKLFQVIVAAFRNRNLSLPENPDDLYENKGDDDDEFAADMIPHSKQFRCLDKAAILPRDAFRPEAWRVCTVSQVEELKVLIRMLPILGSTILMNTCLAQLQTFSVQQGNIMDLHLLGSSSFQVPAASIPVIPLVFMSALVPVYEFIFVPLARRFTGHPNGITTLQRVGVGLVLSAISMAIGALIEVKRRDAFNKEGKRISLFWLSFQYGVFGIADLFTLVGLMDFFYGEAPAGLRSLSTSFSWLSLSFGYFLSTVLVRAVNSVTAKLGTGSGAHGWLYGIDLNQNRLDLFFWFLAILSCINFVLYLLCAKWYKYRKLVDVDNNIIYNNNAARAQHQRDRDDEHEHVKDETIHDDAVALHEKSCKSLEASKDLNGHAMYSTVASIYPSPGAYPSPTPSSLSILMYSPMTLETRELIRP